MIKFCPSCGSESIELKGDRICCPDCNMVFEVKEDGSSKVVDHDPFGKIADKVIEKMKAGVKIDPSEKSDPLASEITPEEKENSDTSNGFINW